MPVSQKSEYLDTPHHDAPYLDTPHHDAPYLDTPHHDTLYLNALPTQYSQSFNELYPIQPATKSLENLSHKGAECQDV